MTRVQRLSAGAIGSAVAALLLGVLVGTLGTVMHRSIQPWGVVVCLTLAFVAAVTVRAWAGFVALAGYAVGLVVTVLVLTRAGPGGDILVPDGQAIGWVWLVGSVAVTVVAALLPRGLFDDRPRRAAHAHGAGDGRAASSRTRLRERARRRSASAVARLPAGVAVITLRWRGTLHAMTASAITSVSLEPPMLLFCVHTDARFRDALDDVDTWSVSVLADDQAPHRRLAGLPGAARHRPARARPAPTGARRRRGVGRRCRRLVRLPDRLRAPRRGPRRRRRLRPGRRAGRRRCRRSRPPARTPARRPLTAWTTAVRAPPVAASTRALRVRTPPPRVAARAIQFARARRLARTRCACVEQRGADD